MNLQINDLNKASQFCAMFNNIKTIVDDISIVFSADKLFIQGMDKGRVYLFEIRLLSGWFSHYELLGNNPITISMKTSVFATILKTREKKQTLSITFNNTDQDNLQINLISDISDEYNKDFVMPLIDVNMDILDTGDTEYDCEFSLPSATMATLMGQLKDFGEDCSFECSEEKIQLCAYGGSNGTMRVTIPIEDIYEYSINEGDRLQIMYGIGNLYDICKCKLSDEVSFALHKEQPLKIIYYLDNESESYMRFFIASKVDA
jgi:proliferating cell nuclear antigen PCNA